jgi:dTDP-L-rhamnose 4-epimerase
VVGSVADDDLVRGALDGCEVVFHQAAHKAVLRSVEHPLPTDLVNTHGTLTMLKASLDVGVRRFVHASSSSIYGGADRVPTSEDEPLAPRSPYAVTKLAAEHYCRVFTELYGLETVALRYFNVYGSRQALSNPYTGVAAIFSSRLLNRNAPLVTEDGLQSRDFVHVSDIARANLLALRCEAAGGRVYNVGTGRPTTVLQIAELLAQRLGLEIKPEITGRFRAGDIRHCFADISRARAELGFEPRVALEDGIGEVIAFVRETRAVDRVEQATRELAQRGLIR